MPVHCQYLVNNTCSIATKLAGAVVSVQVDACEACCKSSAPKVENYVNASIALAFRMAHGQKSTNDINRLLRVGRELPEIPVVQLGEGPGTELHNVIGERGWKIEPNCPCLRTIRKMNSLGMDWCLVHRIEIAGSMTEEWRKRSPVLSKFVPEWMLQNGFLTVDGALNMIDEALELWRQKQHSGAK